jgi:uncharacterized protein (DUF305 family)
MTGIHSRSRTGILAAGLVLAACSSSHGGGARTTPEPVPSDQTSPSSGTSSQATKDSYPYTEADVRFMSGMIGHHAQALVMAGWAPTHGANTSIRTLAERIINGQQDEIATMQRWLRDRGHTVPEPGATGMKMKMGGAEHEMLMPGMLTEAQMKELDRARGREFDRLFLTYMIQHHRGAVSMVNDLFATRGAAREETTFKLANDVSVDQTTEIARMERMLAALPPGQPAQ